MIDTDIRAALEQASGEVRTSPDLLDRVRDGGRRRVARRRTVLVAGLATIAAGSTAGVLAAGGRDGAAPIGSRLLDRPTRGVLKHDTGFLREVRAAWRDHLGAVSRDEPHVAWAGAAPHQGRLAVVAQRVPHEVDSAGRTSYGLTGFVEQTPAGLRVIAVEVMVTGLATSAAVLLGPDRNVLMVLDDGRGIRYSPALSYTGAGAVSRSFRPLDFRVHDGVAFEATETRPVTIRAALRAEQPDALGNHTVGLANLAQLATAAAPDPAPPARQVWSLAGADAELAEGGPWDAETRDDFQDVYGYHLRPLTGTWYVHGVTADRRRFVAQTMTGTDDRTRLLLSLGTPDPVLRGFVEPDAPLAVRLRLPDGQGVVVAGAGRLRYRVAGGSWLPVAGRAALLPAAAAEVEVTRDGRRAVRVGLA